MTRSLLLVVLLGCGSKPSPHEPSASDAIVRVRSNVHDAQVYVDGRFLAPIGSLRGGIAVEPGTHRFELRHDAYFSRYVEVTLGRAERKQIEMDLAPILP